MSYRDGSVFREEMERSDGGTLSVEAGLGLEVGIYTESGGEEGYVQIHEADLWPLIAALERVDAAVQKRKVHRKRFFWEPPVEAKEREE